MSTITLQEAPVARPFPAGVVDEIHRFGADEPGALREPELLLELRPMLPATCAFAQDVRGHIDGPRGFDLVSAKSLPAAYHRLAYAVLGMALAEPVLRYGLLYAVADRGESYLEKQIPVSMTRASTGMHTDSSARDCVPGIVGLLCERPSLEGGTSRVASALGACEWLAEHDPESLRLLKQPYLRDVVTPGMDRDLESLGRNRFPVVSTEPEFQLRYMRYWIEKGHERAGEPLSDPALAAFDALDAALARPKNGAAFRLGGGDVLFVDNQRLVHGRDAYGAVPTGGRLLWRMWLDEKTPESTVRMMLDRATAVD